MFYKFALFYADSAVIDRVKFLSDQFLCPASIEPMITGSMIFLPYADRSVRGAAAGQEGGQAAGAWLSDVLENMVESDIVPRHDVHRQLRRAERLRRRRRRPAGPGGRRRPHTGQSTNILLQLYRIVQMYLVYDRASLNAYVCVCKLV